MDCRQHWLVGVRRQAAWIARKSPVLVGQEDLADGKIIGAVEHAGLDGVFITASPARIDDACGQPSSEVYDFAVLKRDTALTLDLS